MNEQNKYSLPICYAAFLVICLALLPWAVNFFTYATNVDIAFLTLSAERLLAGEAMSQAYYDTNPPLSIIVQIPAVLLHKCAGIPLYYATTIYIFILLGLSLFATNALLKKIDGLSTTQRFIVLCIFLIMNTLSPGYDFGQKDHILGMALFPLVLAQILITTRVDFNKILMWCTLLAGSILILLKPHYGLIPAAIFLHRIIYQKRITVFKDVDFLTLAGMAIGYIAAVFLFFPDFINVILPDIVKYYASDISPAVIKVGVILMIQAIIPLAVCQLFLKKAHPLISVFSAVAVLCLIPFILQGKGWAYHAIPANSFFYCSAGLFIAHLCALGLKQIQIEKFATIGGFLVVIGLLAWLTSQYYAKDRSAIPTHASYMNTHFAKLINSCEEPCSFLVLHDMINISQELSVYTGAQHASRFPTLWFTASLLNAQQILNDGGKARLNQEEIDTATENYTKMIAEDFDKYDPEFIFIGIVPNPAKQGEMFDYKEYLLEKNPDLFHPIWDRYELIQTLDVDRLEYMERKKPGEDLITYKIYKKKN
ncbi:MAG: hypothetical protein ACTHOO_11810 [Alcanivorax sp.]